jgi:hypothetical protein
MGGRPEPTADREVDIHVYNDLSKTLAAKWPKMEEKVEVSMRIHNAGLGEAKSHIYLPKSRRNHGAIPYQSTHLQADGP